MGTKTGASSGTSKSNSSFLFIENELVVGLEADDIKCERENIVCCCCNVGDPDRCSPGEQGSGDERFTISSVVDEITIDELLSHTMLPFEDDLVSVVRVELVKIVVVDADVVTVAGGIESELNTAGVVEEHISLSNTTSLFCTSGLAFELFTETFAVEDCVTFDDEFGGDVNGDDKCVGDDFVDRFSLLLTFDKYSFSLLVTIIVYAKKFFLYFPRSSFLFVLLLSLINYYS